eukprot:7384338-Prymnesium_polylepis.1
MLDFGRRCARMRPHYAAIFVTLARSAALKVCTGPTCGRNGAMLFVEAARALGSAEGCDLEVAESSCLRPCRGVVTKRSNSKLE